MNFLQPAYLWAFAGLLVPLAIHLLSRKEGRVIRIGSIRHIRETPTRQFRSVRLNEYLLLFLRCLLLGGLTLFMSGWYLDGVMQTRQWLLLEPGLENRPALKELLDSLTNAGYERRFLSREFPEELPGDANEVPDYYALLEDLQKRRVDAVIISTNSITGFSGPRLALPENVRWIEVAPEARQEVIRQVRVGRDSVWVRRGSFSATASQFTTNRKSANDNESQAPDTVRIVVAYDQGFETDKEIIIASLGAIESQVPEIILPQGVLTTAYSGSSHDWLIWLSASMPPKGVKSVVRFSDQPLIGILEPDGGGAYLLTTQLTSEVAVNRNLALHLMKVLFPDDQEWALARKYDRRVVSAAAAFGPSTPSTSSGTLGEEADQASMEYLAIALLVILALERLVAYQRKQ